MKGLTNWMEPFTYAVPEWSTMSWQAPRDFLKWFNEEQQRWSFLDGEELFNQTPLPRKDAVRNVISFVERWTPDMAHVPVFKDITRALNKYFEIVPYSESIVGKFLLEESNGKGSDYALGAFVAIREPRIDSAYFSVKALHGFIGGNLFKNGITSVKDLHQQQLIDLEIQVRNKLNESTAAKDQFDKKYGDTLEEMEKWRTEEKNRIDALLSKKDEECNTLIAKHDAKVTELEDLYDKKLALGKPVSYWEKREISHKRMARWLCFCSFFLIAGCGAGLGYFVYQILSHVSAQATLPPALIGVSLTVSFFVIWFVRLVVKLFISNKHLAIDAGERKIMILTYLSFTREGQDIKPDDKKLIFQHIFRSTSDGLVKDDGAPPSIWDILLKKE